MAVFISYSRADQSFADELQRGLEFDGGFEVFIDRQAIHEGEDWKQRLSALIASADAIAFLLSPDSVASPVCHWEVDQAQAAGKRIVPVLLSPVEGASTPRALADLNYVRFDEGRSFMSGLAGLRRALRADIRWLREHTRLGQRAQEWMSADRAENRLLMGPDIVAARQWIERRPADAAPPTELHHDFIAASEAAEASRTSAERARSDRLKRALGATRIAAIAAAIMLVLAVGAGGIAAVQAGLAREAEEAAKASAGEARKSEANATSLLADSLAQRGLEHLPPAGRRPDFATPCSPQA